MDKPLKDYTLGEMQALCKAVGISEVTDDVCMDCRFGSVCGLFPEEWNLDGVPKFTPDELAVLRLLKKGGCEAVSAFEVSTGEIRLILDGWGVTQTATPTLLPSLRPGQKIKLDEIDLEGG